MSKTTAALVVKEEPKEVEVLEPSEIISGPKMWPWKPHKHLTVRELVTKSYTDGGVAGYLEFCLEKGHFPSNTRAVFDDCVRMDMLKGALVPAPKKEKERNPFIHMALLSFLEGQLQLEWEERNRASQYGEKSNLDNDLDEDF